MSFFTNNRFSELLEKATSENIPGAEEDITLNLDIADLIKSKKVQPLEAVNALKKKLNHPNPNVQLLTLKLLDFCIKNGGNHFLVKIAQRDFVDNFALLLRSYQTNPDVKNLALSYFQNWAIAFRSKNELYYLPNVYEELKREGIQFPPYERSEVSGVLIDTETAPEWTDSDVCMRCRQEFTMINRKHHCRNCGLTFCNKCSSKSIPLPKLGITEDVRVCESCYYKITNPSYSSSPKPQKKASSHSHSYNGYPYSYESPEKTPDQSILNKEQDELERAIALSLQEAQPKNEKKVISNIDNLPNNSEEEERQLREAIEASLQDLKLDEGKYNYRESSNDDYSNYNNYRMSNNGSMAGDYSRASFNTEPTNPDELLTTEIENIKLFSQLMEKMDSEAAVKGPQVVNDTQIQALHVQISSLHPKILKNNNYYEDKYKKFYDIHEKLIIATRLYDQILSQRLDAARSGSYTSIYQPPQQSQQQPQQTLPNATYMPYQQNEYAVPPPQQLYGPPPSSLSLQQPPPPVGQQPSVMGQPLPMPVSGTQTNSYSQLLPPNHQQQPPQSIPQPNIDPSQQQLPPPLQQQQQQQPIYSSSQQSIQSQPQYTPSVQPPPMMNGMPPQITSTMNNPPVQENGIPVGVQPPPQGIQEISPRLNKQPLNVYQQQQPLMMYPPQQQQQQQQQPPVLGMQPNYIPQTTQPQLQQQQQPSQQPQPQPQQPYQPPQQPVQPPVEEKPLIEL